MRKLIHIFGSSIGLFLLCTAVSVSSVSAERLIIVDKALKKIYKKADRFEPNAIVLSKEQIAAIEASAAILFEGAHSDQILMYQVYQGQNIAGYAFEDTVIGKWGPIHYLVGLDQGGTILEVIILDYQEIRGKPIAKRRFLRQYKKKTTQDQVMLRKDIDGITGATISSRSLTNGVRKLLYVFEVVQDQ